MNRKLIPILFLLAIAARAEAGSPPLPAPSVWISAGGAVGETAVISLNYPGQFHPYALVFSNGFSSTPGWPPLLPPIHILSVGSIDSQGNASVKVWVPPSSSLIGLPIYLLGEVTDNTWVKSYSPVCMWNIAPNLQRRFVRKSPAVSNPFGQGSSHARALMKDGNVLFCGGLSGGCVPMARSDAWIYDPLKITFIQVGSMTTPRASHVARSLSDGTVLVVGGDFNSTGPTAEFYDPLTKSFKSLGPVSTALYAHTATVVRAPGSGHEYVLIAGGYDAGGAKTSDKALLYDAWNRKFIPLPNMNRARQYAATIAFPAVGAVLITGGQDNGQNAMDDAEIFLLQTRQFYPWGKMARPRYGHAMVRLSATDALILGGGTQYTGSTDLELFSGLAVGSRLLPVRMKHPRCHFNPVVLADGSIVVAGGSSYTTGYADRTPERLTGAGSTLLRPIAEPGVSVALQELSSGGVMAFGSRSVHHLQ